MDPNANLREQLDLAAAIQRLYDQGHEVPERITNRLSELVFALDEWLNRGGFLPTRWERK